MAELIDSTNPRWDALYNLWISEKKPGYVATPGGSWYRVFEPESGNVKFLPMGGIDKNYSTTSMKIKGK